MNNIIKYREFTVNDEQNVSYVTFYADGTCCAYNVDGRDIRIPKRYYDKMLRLVREQWGEDYTATIVNTQMTEAEMKDTANTFVASLTSEVFNNSRISLVD